MEAPPEIELRIVEADIDMMTAHLRNGRAHIAKLRWLHDHDHQIEPGVAEAIQGFTEAETQGVNALVNMRKRAAELRKQIDEGKQQ